MLINLCDGRLFADQYGDGVPQVVALHGWGRSRNDWRQVLRGKPSLAIDLPGFGRSPSPQVPWSTAQYAELVVQCLPAQRVVLVGHSFGGRVAVQIAAKHPEKVEALVLTGVPLLHRQGRPGRAPLGYRVIRLASRLGLVPHTVMEAARQRYGSADYRAAHGAMRGVLVSAVNEEYSEQMSAIRDSGLPVFLIWGEHDEVVPLEIARRAAEAIGKNATLDVVAGSGHLLDEGLTKALRLRLPPYATLDDGSVVP